MIATERHRASRTANAAGVVRIEHFPVAVLVADPAGRVEAVNGPWRQLTGLDSASSADHGWLLCLDHDGRGRIRELIDEVVTESATRTVDRQLHTHIPGHGPWTRWWIRAAADDRDSPSGVVIVVADIDDDVEHRAELEYRAIHDPLTGLANRTQFFELTDHALRNHDRDSDGGHLAVLYLDLDRFKAVNDNHGHSTGDAVLRAVAAALSGAIRPGDVVARVGGDEFAVMCDHLSVPGNATSIAERIQSALSRPLTAGGTTWDIDATIGIAHASRTGENAEQLLDRADRAMYDAKHQIAAR